MKYFGIIALIAIVLTGCSESTIEKADSTPAAAATSSQQATVEETPKAPEVFAIGDTIKFDDLKLTLNGVRTSEGGDFIKPKEDVFLIVDLTIENTGDKPEAISTIMQMSLYDADSYSYSISIGADTKGSLDGEVAPGRKMRGEVAFDVPASDYYEFVFEDPFTTGQAIWKFEAE